MTAISSTVPAGSVSTRKPIISNGVMGMLLFIASEMMLFASLVSAYLIIRSGAVVWPPWGQPRLPVAATGFNTFVLLLSGVTLFLSYRAYKKQDQMKKCTGFLGASVLLGVFFVLFQGYEWVNLINFGMTMTTSTYGALFYLIIGLHAIHAVAAIILMLYLYGKMISREDKESVMSRFATIQLFWFFVVGIWPLLYITIYLV